MLYETLLQGKTFLCCAYFGILASFSFEIKFLLSKLTKNNKILNIIFEILAMLKVVNYREWYGKFFK